MPSIVLDGAPPTGSPLEATDPVIALRVLADQAAAVVEHLDPAQLSPTQAAQVIERCAAIERLAQAGKLLVATRAAEGEGWRRSGHRNAAEWMAATTKCSRGQARALLDTSERLGEQPQVETALRRGTLNADQATAISDAAALDPAAAPDLLSVADRASLAELRDRCAARKAAARGHDANRRLRLWRNRHLHLGADADGAATLTGATTPEAGAIVAAALNPYRELAFRAARAAGRRDSFAALTADALEMLAAAAIGATPTCLLPQPGDQSIGTEADRALEEPQEPAPPTEQAEQADHLPGLFDLPEPDAADDALEPEDQPSFRGRPPDAPRVSRLGECPDTLIPWDPTPVGGAKLPGGRVKVIVRIDHTALLRGHTQAGETCEIAGLGPVPVTSVLELLRTGDPFLAAVLTRGTDVASVVHLGRHPNAFQRTALEWRDPRCVIAGCTLRFGEIDHNEGWALTHDTRTGDLALLCAHHHRLKTTGWQLTGTGHHRRLVPPDDGKPPSPRKARDG